ncbi:MAG: hypothetical protein RL754_1187 [Bacteroidota bacterium]
MNDFISTSLNAEWQPFFEAQKAQPYWDELQSFVQNARRSCVVYPPPKSVFKAFKESIPSDIRCIILGQDPYHGPGQAMGLSFSVPPSEKLPPSLRNIFKEYQSDLDLPAPISGDLSVWAQNGVFLLNTVLTVEARKAGSHTNKGWEKFTSAALEFVLRENPHTGFICFGAPAKKVVDRVLQKLAESMPSLDPVVIATPHPSPLSAYRGFFGSKPFTTFNFEQAAKGREIVHWELPSAVQQTLF